MTRDKAGLKAWRLASQKLGAARCHSPEEVVAWLGGVQAQDYRWAKWSIGLRTDRCNDREVERAIEDRGIVRTWMFRGTLHFVAARDLAWLTSQLAPGIIKGNARRYRQLELDDAVFHKSQKVMRQALNDNGPLTRAELKTHFQKAGVPAEGQQLPYLLQRAALDGLICHGPQRGSAPTFVLRSDRIGPQPSLDRPEALGLLANRYFASHGPATRQDFAWWAGLTARDVRLALDAASKVSPVEVEGVQYWVAADPPSANATEYAYLLPPFDAYLLGYKERSLALDPTHAKRVNAGGGMLKPTVMGNGDILGIWSYKLKTSEMAVSIQLFRDLESREREMIGRAAARLSSFLSLPVDVGYPTSHAN